MTKESFLDIYGFLLDGEDLDDEDFKYIIPAVDELMPCGWNNEGNTQETAIKINCVHNEYVVLKIVYLKYELIKQVVLRYDNKSYDKLIIKTHNDEEIEVWFDISSFFPKAYQNIGE